MDKLWGVNRFFKGNKNHDSFRQYRRIGNRLYISAQSGYDLNGNFHGIGDPAAQANQACENILDILDYENLPITSLCRMRVYVTDRENRKAVYSAIGEKFSGVSLSSTGLTIKALPTPEMLMQIDVEAYIE